MDTKDLVTSTKHLFLDTESIQVDYGNSTYKILGEILSFIPSIREFPDVLIQFGISAPFAEELIGKIADAGQQDTTIINRIIISSYKYPPIYINHVYILDISISKSISESSSSYLKIIGSLETPNERLLQHLGYSLESELYNERSKNSDLEKIEKFNPSLKRFRLLLDEDD